MTTSPGPQMLPRTIRRTTPLAGPATIIYPGFDPAYARLAQRLAGRIEQATGSRPATVADTAAMPARSAPLPATYREKPLILVGNLNTNRAVMTLYARYYCATDATYPGGDGYDLRTIVNPYGAGQNVILAGGSTLRGVERAVERLLAHIDGMGSTQAPELPFVFEVGLTPDLARQLAEWPDTPLGAPLPDAATYQRRSQPHTDALLVSMANYTGMYAWTGDERYAIHARAALRAANAVAVDSYGDWHYRAERIMRFLPWLCASGLLDEADILRTDQLLLGTAQGTADMWWRLRSGNPPLGHRHHGKGTHEFLLLARYLRDQCAPNGEAAALCDHWIEECHAFLDALARAGIDDQDDESTLNNLTTLYWYALSEERFEFYETGMARHVAQRAIALHDNMGAGAGQGGYGEGLAGAMYYQQEATTPVAASAFYYQDGEFKWLLERLPHLAIPIRQGFLGFTPVFIHKFDTGSELAPRTPDSLSGLRALPLAPYQAEINDRPPEHVEPAGHQVNAPETWLRAEGIGVNALRRERGFDKVLVRSGFAPGDAYLLLQGYQGGYRWQGHQQAANCIVRFAQGGHIFLIQNTSRHSHYQKNGLFVSDGYNAGLLPPLAELLAAGDYARVGLSATRLDGFHGGEWTRHLFWSKPAGGIFVVLDTVRHTANGPYSVTCTWRTPGYATWDGHTWQARQGAYRFTLRSSDRLPASNEEEEAQGGANPFVLREVAAGEGRTGEACSFQHVFYARPEDAPEEIDIQRLAGNQALLRRDGAPLAWYAVAGAGPEIAGPGFRARALSAWAGAEEIALAGATELAWTGEGGWRFRSDAPIGLHLDLAAAQLTALIDGPGVERATLTVQAGAGAALELRRGETYTLPLPEDGCAALSLALRSALDAIPAAAEPPLPSTPAADWPAAWVTEAGTEVPERIRDLTVEADPPPIDGFADQLVDTILPEMRETWQQWPPAPEYRITLRFPQAVALDHLRIVGDSRLDPTLRNYNPLPEGISAAASGDEPGDGARPCVVAPVSGTLPFKRYRDMEDRLETRDILVDGAVRQVQLRIPAPADGRPLCLHEVEVYGSRKAPAKIRHLSPADLQGDGRRQVVAVDEAGQLTVVDQDGRLLWQRRLPGICTHLSCHDLDGEGRHTICAGMAGGTLLLLAADGEVRQTLPLGDLFLKGGNTSSGWFNSVDSLAVWHRGPDGRAALVVGGYAILLFLDPEGNILGHSWNDGPWVCDLLPGPPDARGARDLWARNGWNHGIGFYEGYPGLAPSGEGIYFGGVRQAMFRPMRRVIPFVNGRTAAFAWLESGNILAAAENGVGVLSASSNEWLWKIEGGTPINACVAGNVDGQDAVLVGGADGFLAAFAVPDGRPLRRLYIGAPVVGLAGRGGHVAVANRDGVLALDPDWQVRRRHIAPVQMMRDLGSDGLVLALRNGRLEMLRWGL